MNKLPARLKNITEKDLVVNRKKELSADEIDALLRSFPPLYFKEYVHKRMKFSEFLKVLFDLNNKYPTYIDGTTTIQCTSGRRRSIPDIYRICMYYYPRTTSIRLISGIFGKWDEENKLSSRVCEDHRRRMFRHNEISKGSLEQKVLHANRNDEFGLTWPQFLALKDQK